MMIDSKLDHSCVPYFLLRMNSIVKTGNKKSTTFVKTRGWESCWYKLEGGDGGARSGHGTALLGQKVLTFSLFPFHLCFLC